MLILSNSSKKKIEFSSKVFVSVEISLSEDWLKSGESINLNVNKLTNSSMSFLRFCCGLSSSKGKKSIVFSFLRNLIFRLWNFSQK